MIPSAPEGHYQKRLPRRDEEETDARISSATAAPPLLVKLLSDCMPVTATEWRPQSVIERSGELKRYMQAQAANTGNWNYNDDLHHHHHLHHPQISSGSAIVQPTAICQVVIIEQHRIWSWTVSAMIRNGSLVGTSSSLSICITPSSPASSTRPHGRSADRQRNRQVDRQASKQAKEELYQLLKTT